LYTEEKLHNNPEGKALLLFDACFCVVVGPKTFIVTHMRMMECKPKEM